MSVFLVADIENRYEYKKAVLQKIKNRIL